MNLLLISQTTIIKQIFNLVSTKLDIALTISDINISHKMFDIIIIEDNLLDDQFPLQEYAKRLGIISKDQTLYINKSDFVLPKPFLPSTLASTLENQINSLKNHLKTKIEDENIIKKVQNDEQETTDAVEFIESLANDISDEIIEESDESIVSPTFMQDGGILDSSELSKIQDMLVDNPLEQSQEVPSIEESNNEEVDEWIDLSDIIDKAIDEVREYNFDTNTPIKLILNDYSMQEVSPLLNKLDQSIIDALTNGEEITIQLKVEKK